MFCSKCGAKAKEGAAFCEKCGAKLAVTDVGSTTTERSIRADMFESAEPPAPEEPAPEVPAPEEPAPEEPAPEEPAPEGPASEVSKAVEQREPEIMQPDKSAISKMNQFSGAAEQAVSETNNIFESVSVGDVYDLLRENTSDCPEIKEVDFQPKTGITTIRGKKNRYFVGFSRGDYRLCVCPKLLFSVYRIIFWFVIWFTVYVLIDGGDLEEIYPFLGLCLLIGGAGGIVSEVICKREKKEIVPFIKERLSKAVCVKGPVVPITEPLLLRPRLWFLGFSLPVASVIQPILYSVAVLAGIVILIVGSGVLDRMGTSNHRDEFVYDTYNGESEAETYMPSSGPDNILLSNTYSNKEEGFSFMYPSDWEEENLDDAIVAVIPKNALSQYAIFVVEKSFDDGSLFELTEVDFEIGYASIEGINDFKMVGLSDVSLDGYPARKLTYTCKNENEERLSGIQYFYVNGTDLYQVECLVLEDAYDFAKPQMDAIMDAPEPALFLETPVLYDYEDITYQFAGTGGDGWAYELTWDIIDYADGYELEFIESDGYGSNYKDYYEQAENYFVVEGSEMSNVTIRVRAYAEVQGQRVYSGWSEPRSATLDYADDGAYHIWETASLKQLRSSGETGYFDITMTDWGTAREQYSNDLYVYAKFEVINTGNTDIDITQHSFTAYLNNYSIDVGGGLLENGLAAYDLAPGRQASGNVYIKMDPNDVYGLELVLGDVVFRCQ